MLCCRTPSLCISLIPPLWYCLGLICLLLLPVNWKLGQHSRIMLSNMEATGHIWLHNLVKIKWHLKIKFLGLTVLISGALVLWPQCCWARHRDHSHWPGSTSGHAALGAPRLNQCQRCSLVWLSQRWPGSAECLTQGPQDPVYTVWLSTGLWSCQPDSYIMWRKKISRRNRIKQF